MAGKRKRRVLRRRNPLVPAVRKLGHKVKASARGYKRRPKHPGAERPETPDPETG
jgi:hypothetical protein